MVHTFSTMTSTPACYSSLTQLSLEESSLYNLRKVRAAAPVYKEYVLCPNTTFVIAWQGFADPRTVALPGNFTAPYPLTLWNPNRVYKCGADGSFTNNCVFAGGDYQVLAPRRDDALASGDFLGPDISNTAFQGITFGSSGQSINDTSSFGYAVALFSQATNVTFTNCVFAQNRGGMGTCLFETADEADQNITIQNCAFVNNNNSVAIVSANSDASTGNHQTTLINNIFEANDAKAVVLGSNSDVVVRQCCFENNLYLDAPIKISRSNQLDYFSNYVSLDSGAACKGALVTDINMFSICLPFTETSCLIFDQEYGTIAPSITPSTSIPTSNSPSITPSFTPSFASSEPSITPTMYPSSNMPSVTPSGIPTTSLPSLTPSIMPSFKPSKMPTTSPTTQPSSAPSGIPSWSPTTAKPTITIPSLFLSATATTSSAVRGDNSLGLLLLCSLAIMLKMMQ